jgi:hypothetical protein
MADNLTLGRGELWFDRFDDLARRGERYIGNTPEFSLSVEIDTIEHFNSDRGFKDKDESAVRSMNWNGSFITDNISVDNMSFFFSGKGQNFSTGAVASGTDVITRVVKGLTYQIGTSITNPSGVRKLTSAALTKGLTPMVVDVDYTIDLEMGRFTLKNASSVVSNGDAVNIAYVAPAQSRSQVISGREPVSGALRYIAMNPVGSKLDYYMPYVKITPNGDFALKGDDWQQISFNVEVLRKEDYEAIYLDGRPVV